MEGRLAVRDTCQTVQRSLYSPLYDDMLEHRQGHEGRSRTEAVYAGAYRRKRKVFSKIRDFFSKRRLLNLLLIAMVITFIFGAIGVHADSADFRDTDNIQKEDVYQLITVESGDTLWDIARRCSSSTDDSIRTYIEKIRQMNHIHGDYLQEGQQLLIYHGISVE